MKITLESTDQMVNLGHGIQARVWEGTTESGIAMHAYIASVGVHKSLDNSEFERELREIPHKTCSPEVRAIDIRHFID